MWYLTIQRWTTDPQRAIGELLDDHLAWLDDQLRAGTVLLGGPSADLQLGIIVFRAENASEADRLCRTEPFVAAGYREFDLIEWDVQQVFGVQAARRRS
ncbi:YciI family protein [Amycolatopsis jejuensis]|uniref:YciI family protein n=1 Tax=Amycolatopsis jejuensis TaxID=330084 RepID=UPI0005262C33|nr:YciI family protein [Amycolatopsis jejuensis]